MQHPGTAALAVAAAIAASTLATAARAATSPAPPSTAQNEDRSHEKPSRRPVRVGALAGIGFPRPLAIEPLVELGRYAAFGAEYGVLPRVAIGGAMVDMWSLAGDGRVFPFGGPFYVGVRAGWQHVGAAAPIALGSYGTVDESLGLDTWFVNPRVGLLWVLGGLALGVEAGVQLPVEYSVSSTLPLSRSPAAEHAAESLGRAILPTVDLLRVGVLL